MAGYSVHDYSSMTPGYSGYSYGTPSYGYPSYGAGYGTTMANPFEHHLPMGMYGAGSTPEAPKEKKTRSVTLKKKVGKACCGCC